MNNKIREFEKLSGLEIHSLGRDRVKWESCLDKFTELIVKECITIVQIAMVNTPQVVILEHILIFGIDNEQ